MKIAGVFLFLALTGVSAQIGLLKTALRVKWGIPLVDKEFFIDIPREEADIKKEGWAQVDRPDTHLPSLKLYCPDGDYTVCTMYDDTGFIAGIQVAMQVNKLKKNPTPMDRLGFLKWTAPDGFEYWTNQQYFISEESLNKSAVERIAARSEDTLQEGAVWVRDLDGSLLRVASTQSGIQQQGVFEKQACIVSMAQWSGWRPALKTRCRRRRVGARARRLLLRVANTQSGLEQQGVFEKQACIVSMDKKTVASCINSRVQWSGWRPALKTRCRRRRVGARARRLLLRVANTQSGIQQQGVFEKQACIVSMVERLASRSEDTLHAARCTLAPCGCATWTAHCCAWPARRAASSSRPCSRSRPALCLWSAVERLGPALKTRCRRRRVGARARRLLLRVASTQSGLEQQAVFEKQACIVSMGDHYYKNLKQDDTCDAIYPWFMTVNDGNLVASGMLIIGELPEVPEGMRVWFEHPSVSVVKTIVDQGPQCLFDLVEEVGGYTMHIYYGKHPYLIFC
ncbi:unnamed protein product [Plutella xylostella]|uniref:(diamondback moth) hypothetical protein n=1 Tax=Plutella xylostella TaxID=51655 RepID=A0A8S4G9J4_PLUXY|nr:unnamed protein product [Plutella xylostella]